MTASYAVPKERSFSRRQKSTPVFMLFELVSHDILVKIYDMVIYVRLLCRGLIITFKTMMSSQTNNTL